MPPIGFLFGFPFSLVWAAPLGWVDGDGCGWSCVNQVTFVSNVTIRSFLSSGAMVLRLDPSMISFGSIFLLVPVLGIISASIVYRLQRMIVGLLMGFSLACFLLALPV